MEMILAYIVVYILIPIIAPAILVITICNLYSHPFRHKSPWYNWTTRVFFRYECEMPCDMSIIAHMEKYTEMTSWLDSTIGPNYWRGRTELNINIYPTSAHVLTMYFRRPEHLTMFLMRYS
jgi:hypothetical protein